MVEITDPTAAREGIEVLDQDVVHLDQDPLRVRRMIARLDSTWLVYQTTNRRVRTRTRVGDAFMAFSAIGPTAGGTVDGREMRADRLLVAEPGTEAELVVQPGYESIAVLIGPADLERHLRDRGRGDEFQRPRGIELRRPAAGAARALFKLGRRLVEAAAARPAPRYSRRCLPLWNRMDLSRRFVASVRGRHTAESPGSPRTGRWRTRGSPSP